jgi:hypothetical protein
MRSSSSYVSSSARPRDISDRTPRIVLLLLCERHEIFLVLGGMRKKKGLRETV